MGVAANSDIMRQDISAALMSTRAGAVKFSPAQMQKVRQTAQNFEAVFIGEMLKPMFENIQAVAPFGGGAGDDTWKQMQIDEYGKAIAKRGGIGLADSVVKTMLQMQAKQELK